MRIRPGWHDPAAAATLVDVEEQRGDLMAHGQAAARAHHHVAHVRDIAVQTGPTTHERAQSVNRFAQVNRQNLTLAAAFLPDRGDTCAHSEQRNTDYRAQPGYRLHDRIFAVDINGVDGSPSGHAQVHEDVIQLR